MNRIEARLANRVDIREHRLLDGGDEQSVHNRPVLSLAL
jgi:hypothetical protein